MDCNLFELSPFLLLSREPGYTETGKSSGSFPHGEFHRGKSKLSQGEILGLPTNGYNRAQPLILGFIFGSSNACTQKPHSALANHKKSDVIFISAYLTPFCLLLGVIYVASLKPQNLNIEP